jgi:hypothetical protein
MKKRITTLLMMVVFCGAALLAQRVPMASFQFSEGEGGWIVKDMSDQTATGFVFRTQNYWEVPANHWYTGGAKSQIRHSWIISPVIDLTNGADTELLVSGAGLYGTDGANQMELYIQTDASLNLNEADPTAFLTQWGDIHTDLNNDAAIGTDFGASAKTAVGTTNPLNMAMYDGMKVRIGIRFFNPAISDANTRNLCITAVNVSANNTETDPPVNSVTAIDSVGNTFARGWFTADEICKMYWAIKPQGGTVADLAEIKANLGSDAFVSSGTFDYNIVGGSTPFEMAGLEINTAYTLLYGAEDFLNNASAVASVDFSSDNDLVAPVISSIAVDNITEVSAIAHVMADEAGEIMLRVYESGWEPDTYEQFENGQGSVVNVNAYKVYDFVAAADTLLEYLEPAMTYIVYGTVTDLTGNISEIFKSDYFSSLADAKAPVITSATIANITNHGGDLTLVCDEPVAGFGDVIAHWVATTQGTVLTSAQVLSRENGLASGTAALDSATYDNLIPVDNLEKNTAYTIHCVAVDETENVSAVTAIDMTTTNLLEEVPLYLQEFDVANLNYHFATVTMPEGGIGWESDPANSWVRVNNNVKTRDVFYDTWCVVGPIDLTGVLDIAAEWQGEKTYGSYADKLSLWVTDAYTGDGVIDINNWTQVSQPGDFANAAGIQSVKQPVPAGFDKAGVYFAFRYYHDVWAHSWNINWLKIYGSRVGITPTPVIDWVETSNPGSTSVNMMFTANTYGRAYWYLAEEVGGVAPAAPTMDQVKSGANASAHGYVEYTAGNYIDQNFTLSGLKPNTTYHLYTVFRDLEYTWAADVFYDDWGCVFTTKSLEITSATESLTLATGANLQMTALSEGRLYWTVKEQGLPAPANFDEIYASFDTKGAFNYNFIDESPEIWYTGNKLMPETAYTAYLIMTEGTREHYSAIQSIDFTTPAIQVTQATHDPAVLMAGETDKYSVTFNAQTSSMGWIHLVMTAKGAAEPAIEDILDISAGFGGQKFSLDNPADVVLQIDNLTQDQGENFTAWLVIASGEYISPVYQLDSTTPTAISEKGNASVTRFMTIPNGIKVDFAGKKTSAMTVYNVVGQVVDVVNVNPGMNTVIGLTKGIYILILNEDGKKVSRKVIVQ